MEISDIKTLELKSDHRSERFQVWMLKVCRLVESDYHVIRSMNRLDYADLRRKNRKCVKSRQSSQKIRRLEILYRTLRCQSMALPEETRICIIKKGIRTMTQEEMTLLADLIAKRTAPIVIKQLKEMRVDESNDLIDSREAARQLWACRQLMLLADMGRLDMEEPMFGKAVDVEA